MSDAATGALSGELIGWLLLYRLPGFLELILPISFFLAIMLAHGRLHVDNELQVLKSAGFGEGRLIGLTLIQGVFVMLLTSLIVFWLRPAAELGIQEVKASQKSMTEFDLLVPGRFQVLNSGATGFQPKQPCLALATKRSESALSLQHFQYHIDLA